MKTLSFAQKQQQQNMVANQCLGHTAQNAGVFLKFSFHYKDASAEFQIKLWEITAEKRNEGSLK